MSEALDGCQQSDQASSNCRSDCQPEITPSTTVDSDHWLEGHLGNVNSVEITPESNNNVDLSGAPNTESSTMRKRVYHPFLTGICSIIL